MSRAKFALEPTDFARVLADNTRQRIMAECCCRWLTVSEIVERVGVTQPTVSHHLAMLKKTGLVQTRQAGKYIYYTLDQERVAACCGRLMEVFAPEVGSTPAGS